MSFTRQFHLNLCQLLLLWNIVVHRFSHIQALEGYRSLVAATTTTTTTKSTRTRTITTTTKNRCSFSLLMLHSCSYRATSAVASTSLPLRRTLFIPITAFQQQHHYHSKSKQISGARSPFTLNNNHHQQNAAPFRNQFHSISSMSKKRNFNTMSTMMASASSSSSISSPSNHKKLIIVLAGPTAVGKSSIGSKLCSREMASDILTNHALYNTNNGENENAPSTSTSTTCRGHIISADSVQTYQGVQIGANKPTKEEIERTPHHLINIVDGDSVCQYNAADWMNDALHVIHKLTNYDNYPQTKNEGTGDSSDENDTGNRGGKENENKEKEFGEELILELKKRRGRIDKYISDSLHLSSNGDNLDGSESVVGDSDTVAANSTVLPVIVGGTMMYLQWLVHGRPDAMKPSKDALNKAALTVAQFQRQEEENEKEEEIQQATTVTPIADVEEVSQSAENSASASASTPNTNTNETEQNPPTGWQAAVDHVSSLGPIFAERVSKLPGKDWYRLRRTLEVAYTVLDDVENKINIEDLFNGQREGGLDSMEYDVRCFFLCPDDRMAHTAVIDSRCEDMILSGLLKETTDLSLAGLLPTGGQQARAIGYRQTLDYLNRESVTEKDAASFGQYLDDFTAATRRYAKKQMQWFRRDDKFIFVPVKLSDPSSTRVDAAANMIRDMCVLPRQDFEKELLPPPPKTGKDSRANDEMGGNLSISAKTKLENEKQGKGMKFYRGVRHKLIEGSDAYGRIIIEADECTSRIKDLP